MASVLFEGAALSLALKSMRRYIMRIEAFEEGSDRRKEIQGLKDLIIEGEKLVLEYAGIHSLDFIKRYRYSKKLRKLHASIIRYITVLEVQRAADLREILSLTRKLKDCRELDSGLVGGCTPPSLKEDPVGLEFPLRDLKRKFFEEDVPLVVLSAPAGCGKTTLAIAFCQDEEVKGKFKQNIFFTVVSRKPTIEGIGRRLFRHKGYKVPDFQSDEDVVHHLEQFLKTIGEPILLVLDDVWPESESLLEKIKFQIPGYKILVTSIYVFPRFGPSHNLKPLNDEDSMTLFRNSALPRDHTRDIPVEEDAMRKIVKCCKGFPLAISVIGKSLYGGPAAEWRKRAKECSTSILPNFEEALLHRLQICLDALDDAAKECFLDLGSFPEDHRIPVATLADIWVGSQKLDEDNAIKYLHRLCNLNLVELTRKDTSELDGFYSLQFVKQHDLLRELAILQSERGAIESRKRLLMDIRENKIPEWWAGQNQPLIDANFLSISTDKKFKASSWCCMQAPVVEVLVLNFQSENYVLPEFMKTMHNLKVLTATNYGLFPVELDNFPLPSPSNLKRIRLEKVSLTSSFVTSMRLNNLEKISLVMCNIGEAFCNLEIQIPDALPNLVELNIDYCNDLEELPAGFCDLIRLQKLSITNCHKLTSLPEDIGKLMNLEVLRLNSCIELSELPGTIGNLCSLRILDLSECSIITQLPEQIGALSNLAKLYMVDCSICELPASVASLHHLEQVIVDEETATSWKQYEYFLPALKIKVHNERLTASSSLRMSGTA